MEKWSSPGGDGTQLLPQAGSCAVPNVWWHGPVTSRAGLRRRGKGPAMALPSLGSPLFPGLLSLPRFPIPPLGPHPSSGSPWHPHSIWISSQGPHPSLKSLSFVGPLPGLPIPPWAPHPSLGPLSLPRVPTPPPYPCPSPGSPSLPVVRILPRHPCPSPASLSLPRDPVSPRAPCTLASSRSVRLVRGSACCSRRLKSFGVRTAGAKKRRKRNPLMEKYRTSWPGTGTAQGSGRWPQRCADPQPWPCCLPHLVLH